MNPGRQNFVCEIDSGLSNSKTTVRAPIRNCSTDTDPGELEKKGS